jgi:hypothetical protein
VRLTARFLVVLALLGMAAPADAASSAQLALARSQFAHGEYKKVVDTLEPALYPLAHISDEDELKEAHYLLGTSYFFLDRQEPARQEFTALLFLDPSRELDPAADDPRVYQFFTKLKSGLKEKLDWINQQKKREEAERSRPSREVVITRTIHDPAPAISNFIPFGYGQFRNHQTGKGILFLVTEFLAAGTSIGTAAYQVGTYGLPSRYTTQSDADTIRFLRASQVISGGLFIALYALGTWDAFANRPPPVEEKRTEQILPVPPPGPAPAKPQSELRLVPILAPHAAGVGAEWRF